MAEESWIKYVLLVPVNYNDGSSVPMSVKDEIETQFFLRFPGFTVAGYATGAYKMNDGSRQDDKSIIYWIGVQSNQEEELKEYVSELAELLGQESMYLERTYGDLEFVKPQGKGGVNYE